jgi:hypothetical protein
MIHIIGHACGRSLSTRSLVDHPAANDDRSRIGDQDWLHLSVLRPFETAIRQTLSGAYFKAEYSQAYGQHWRATASAALIRGEPDDFLGQYRLNSHGSVVLRYSF